MILPDVNLLIHAYNLDSPAHPRARAWWEGVLNGQRPVALAWVAALGFIRVTTHPTVLARPLPVSAACRHVRSWLAQPQVLMLEPGRRHAEILLGLLERVGTAGNLTTDAHLAALAIERQCELFSSDADFTRFPGLLWTNPIAAPP